MSVAESLNKTLQEMGNMSLDELGYWLAYFQVKAERVEQERARRRRIRGRAK